MKVVAALSFLILLSRQDFTFAQSAVPPISEESCDALKSIAQGTATSVVAQCTVQDGCGALMCVSSSQGSSVLTLQPCTAPPSVAASFYDTSDELVEEDVFNGDFPENIVMLGSATSLTFVYCDGDYQYYNSLNLTCKNNVYYEVDGNYNGLELPYIPYTEIPIDASLCSNSTASNSTATNSSTSSPLQPTIPPLQPTIPPVRPTATFPTSSQQPQPSSSPMQSESPTSAGTRQAAITALPIFLCCWIIAFWKLFTNI